MKDRHCPIVVSPSLIQYQFQMIISSNIHDVVTLVIVSSIELDCVILDFTGLVGEGQKVFRFSTI